MIKKYLVYVRIDDVVTTYQTEARTKIEAYKIIIHSYGLNGIQSLKCEIII